MTEDGLCWTDLSMPLVYVSPHADHVDHLVAAEQFLGYTFHRCQSPSVSFMDVTLAWIKYTGVLHQTRKYMNTGLKTSIMGLVMRVTRNVVGVFLYRRCASACVCPRGGAIDQEIAGKVGLISFHLLRSTLSPEIG